MAENRATSAVQRRGRHRKTPERQPYSWLGPAALTFGVGTALFSGTAVAHADDAASASSASAGSDHGAATSPQTRPDAGPARGRGPRVARHADTNPGAAAAAAGPASGRTHGSLPATALIPAVKQPSAADTPAAASPDLTGNVVSPPERVIASAAVAVAVSPPVQVAPAADATAAPAAVVEPAVAVGTPPAPKPAAASAATAVDAVAGSVTATDTALTPGGDPLAPAGQAVSTVVLAAARRELGAAPAAATPTPAVADTVGAPRNPAPAPAAAAPAASSAPTGTASTKTFTVRANPFLMSASPDGRYIYTTNLADSNGISGVSRLDTISGEVTWLQQKDDAVYALTTGPNGNVYVLSNRKDSAALEIFGNGLNRVLVTIPISNTQGSAVSVSQNGKTAVVGGFDGKLSVIDIAANKVTKTVNVGSWVYGAAVSPDGKTAWVNTEGGTGVSAVNLKTGAVTTVKFPSGYTSHPGSIAISADGRTVYAGGSQVAVINAATKKVTGTVGTFATNANIARIVASSDGKYLYTSDRGNQTISVISLPTRSIVKNIPVGGNGDVFGMTLSPDNTTLYWAGYDRSQIAQRVVAVVPTATNLFAPADHAANQVVVQKVLGPDNTTRMIVYMSGVNSDLSARVQTYLGARLGKLQDSVNDYVNQAYNDWRPSEIMLVGLSGGGVQMQNYAAGGSNSDARKAIRAVLLYGAPLSKTRTDLGVGAKSKVSVLDIVDKGDKLVPWLNQGAAVDSFTSSRNDMAAIYSSDTKSPSRDDPWNVLSYVIPLGNHSDTTYYSAAQEFDKYANSAKASGEFRRIRNEWQGFAGIILDERSTTIAYA